MIRSRPSEDRVMRIKHLEGILGYTFTDLTLAEIALTHRSVAGKVSETYERMEFLGDAVAALIVAEYLYESDEQYSEGEMTEIKSAVVSRSSMMLAGRRLKLDKFLRVDEGLADSASLSNSLVSDAYEALIGAIFLDSGLNEAKAFIFRTLDKELAAAETIRNNFGFKSKLQERLQAKGGEEPDYEIVEISGPAHNRRFKAEVTVRGKIRGSGRGRTKKEAEKLAAKEALAEMFPEEIKQARK